MRSSVKTLIIIPAIFLFSCHSPTHQTGSATGEIKGDIIIFHAGSLALPFQKIARGFEKEYPGTRVLLEAAGSVDCARKITDLRKPCDLMASSDYKIINKFLIPQHTSWQLPFAGNEIVIAYTEKSKTGHDISLNNWPELLIREDIRYGRSDPDADPCGYRTLMVMQLAGAYYGKEYLADELSAKDRQYIRPKEVDLLALLDLNEIDYIFIYRSVAIQHGLKYLELPDEINLQKPELNEQYRLAAVTIKGNTPSSTLEIRGEAIVYAITMLDDAQNPGAAVAFLHYLLMEDKGMKVMEHAGHNSLLPIRVNPGMHLPEFLKQYTIENTDSISPIIL
jgi:molybdate/tungstate transport system substrate-binding protein